MFYRRKILLALVEIFGNELDNTDFEKLMFLYCKEFNQKFYEFFPYKFGCFSFVSYHDKRILTQQGFLKNSDNFILNINESFLIQLKQQDRNNLNLFYNKMKNYNSNEIIKKTYFEYPYYASKSEVIDKFLTSNEKTEIISSNQFNNHPALFTIGYESLTIDSFLNKLIENNIKMVIDVRKNPFSMKLNFSKKKLSDYLSKVEINYIHIPELGIKLEFRQNLSTLKDYKELFILYEKEVLQKRKKDLKMIINFIKLYRRIALMCFEKDYQRCHRHIISNYLSKYKNFDIKIIHL
ncbi:MAG: DUF488 domain-containing protein [Candidatus Cloacimonetes bacterium]|nr:DUF488 domain-containing protein [Candidatus Cloacimonadota bacterium]